MIKINLLPYREIQKKERIWMQMMTMIAVVIAGFILLGLLHWRIAAYENGLVTEREEINKEIADLDKKLGQIDKIKAQKTEIERKLKVIDMLNTKRAYATILLYKIAEAVPERLWLMSVQEREKEVAIDGESMLASDVSSFMERLDKTGLFQKVNVLLLEQQIKAEQKIIKFNIIAVKVEGAPKS